MVDGTPIESVLGPASAQLIRSAVFDVSHTGESMTAERLSLTEVRRRVPGPAGRPAVRRHRRHGGARRHRHRRARGSSAPPGVARRTDVAAEPFAVRGASRRRALAEVNDTRPVALILVDVDRLCGRQRVPRPAPGRPAAGRDRPTSWCGRSAGPSVVSRVDGDEFDVLTMPCASTAEATERAAAVSAVLDRPFDVDGHLISVQASVGVVIAPDHAEDARTALRLAQGALERAKVDDGRFVVHEPATPSGSIHRLALLSELRQGLANPTWSCGTSRWWTCAPVGSVASRRCCAGVTTTTAPACRWSSSSWPSTPV